jgi:putative oxidoreductase
MKIAVLIARILLGLEFVFFGLNGFLNFLKAPPPPGVAGQFIGAIFVSHYSVVIFGLQLISGLLLLSGRYVPLALTILAGMLVNIVTFHVTMAPAGLPMALVTVILWFVVFYSVRGAFAGIFAARA